MKLYSLLTNQRIWYAWDACHCTKGPVNLNLILIMCFYHVICLKFRRHLCSVHCRGAFYIFDKLLTIWITEWKHKYLLISLLLDAWDLVLLPLLFGEIGGSGHNETNLDPVLISTPQKWCRPICTVIGFAATEDQEREHLCGSCVQTCIEDLDWKRGFRLK